MWEVAAHTCGNRKLAVWQMAPAGACVRAFLQMPSMTSSASPTMDSMPCGLPAPQQKVAHQIRDARQGTLSLHLAAAVVSSRNPKPYTGCAQHRKTCCTAQKDCRPGQVLSMQHMQTLALDGASGRGFGADDSPSVAAAAILSALAFITRRPSSKESTPANTSAQYSPRLSPAAPKSGFNETYPVCYCA